MPDRTHELSSFTEAINDGPMTIDEFNELMKDWREPLTLCSNCEHTCLQHESAAGKCLKCDCPEMRNGGRYAGGKL